MSEELPGRLAELEEALAGLTANYETSTERTEHQNATVARLAGQVATLDRSQTLLRKEITALAESNDDLLMRSREQAAETQELREELAALPRVADLPIGSGDGSGVSSNVQSAQARPSWVARLGAGLPRPLRTPLRHLYYAGLGLAAPDNERVRNYREGRLALRAQAADLAEQRKLFKQLLAAGSADKCDVIVFPVIDWRFRVQRPQHIATGLAALGHRVLYLSTSFSAWPGHPGFNVSGSPAPNVFLVELYCPAPHPVIYEALPLPDVAHQLVLGIEVLRNNFSLDRCVCVLQHPFWRQVVSRVQNALLVYDCMDYHAGFTTSTPSLDEQEELLLAQADLVVTTSQPLSDLLAERVDNVIIRNAADVEHFASPPKQLAIEGSRPVVGYFGAISSWFDSQLVAEIAARYPEWDFVLVGSTYEADIQPLQEAPNVSLLGEVPYEALPGYLHAFDVCIIPFLLSDLIRCTNPVKLYEYLSAGKPVVSTDLPELRHFEDLVHVADSPDEFSAKLQVAMDERHDPELTRKRSQWAAAQTWFSRATAFEQAIALAYPPVSVVVLTYNNLEITKACLYSLERYSHYPNLELIIVDNGSSAETRSFLRSYEGSRPLAAIKNVRILLNEKNMGFAAGNNAGIREASGDYIVLLNNDTFVTSGWVLDLIRHFRASPRLGLVGPVTNNIGNEARIQIEYATMQEMASESRSYTRAHSRELLRAERVAFFCVAISRAVLAEVGLLDEDFALGFFEDDDYCNRVREAGYEIGIADDVFVHHHLSASFDALDRKERDALFDRNRRLYEAKWGEWQPHVYRGDS